MSINLQSHSVDRNSIKNHTQCLKNQENIRPKKKLSCFRKSAGWNFFYHLSVRIVAFVSEYIFFVSNKKTHTERNKKQKKLKKIEKQKKLKKIEKQKKLKKKRRKKMLLLLLTISVENLMGHDDIVWQFALSTFNLRDQPTKRERQLKNNKRVCIYSFTFCLRWKPRNVNAVKTFLSIYSIRLSFSTFNIKMIEFRTLKTVTSTLSKSLL